jgi:hypothetical protein
VPHGPQCLPSRVIAEQVHGTAMLIHHAPANGALSRD